MPKNIGIKELAKIANVSIGTIDRVIHNRPGVSEKTRSKVLAIIEEYNYKPNLLAKHLASRKQYKVAVLMPASTANPVWEPYANGIIKASADMDKFSVTVDYLSFDEYEEASFDEVAEKALTYDAVMMVPLFEARAHQLQEDLAAADKVCLSFDTNLPQEDNRFFIGQHAFQAGRLCASLMNYAVPADKALLLVNLGRKAGYHLNFWGRENGFRAFFEDANAPKRELLNYEGPIEQADHLELGLAKLLSENPNIGGIFVPNSRVYWVARILEQLKRNDLILLGFDLIPENTAFLQKGTIDFLINQHPEAQAYRGVEWLMQRLVFAEGGEPKTTPIDVVMRENLEK
jgi:LacI family transcriptional regulator